MTHPPLSVSVYQNDFGRLMLLGEQARELSAELTEKRDIANALKIQGFVASVKGDYATARALYEQGLTISRELGDKRGIAESFSVAAHEAFGRGDYTGVRTLPSPSPGWRPLVPSLVRRPLPQPGEAILAVVQLVAAG